MPLAPNAQAKDYIHDFVHSKNERFKGKDKKTRIRMALGAYYESQAKKHRKKIRDKKKKKKALKEDIFLELAPDEEGGEHKPFRVKIGMKINHDSGVHSTEDEVNIPALSLTHAIHKTKGYLENMHKMILKDYPLKYADSIEYDSHVWHENQWHQAAVYRKKLKEDVAVNNIGGGNIEGAGIGPNGEPGVKKKRKRKLVMAFMKRCL